MRIIALAAAALCAVLGCERYQKSGREAVAPFTAPLLPSADEFATATEAWRWRMPATARPLLITALGDVFVQLPDGSVHFLDTAWGELEKVAASEAAWERLLRRRSNVEKFFRPDFVAELQRQHSPLKPPYVYSPTVPLVLSGQLTKENYTASRWDAHLHVMGQIHRQVKDLPEGTRITKIHVDPW